MRDKKKELRDASHKEVVVEALFEVTRLVGGGEHTPSSQTMLTCANKTKKTVKARLVQRIEIQTY
eukprot:7436294-Prorocentrum_lima.AAC.1